MARFALPSVAALAVILSSSLPGHAGDTLCQPVAVDVCTAEDLEAIPTLTLSNKLWNVTATPGGYSDLAIRGMTPFVKRDPRDPDGPQPLHEGLSGEFGTMVSYNGGAPIYVDGCYIYPTYRTNSNFSIVQPVQYIGDPDLDGLDEARSIVQNPDLELTVSYDWEIVPNGVAMGRGGLGGAAYELSDPYALKFTYDLKNISAATLTGVSFYQFAAMHPANSETPIVDIAYDDVLHAVGDFQDYRWDITATATNSGLTDGFATGSMFTDHVGFSSNVAPGAWGLGSYRGHNPGDPGLPASGGLKPLEGEHCDIENQALANELTLLQEEAAGSMRFDLGDLAPSEMKSVSVLFLFQSRDSGVSDQSCLQVVDDTGPDPVISLNKGACVGGMTAGPYDVIMGSVDRLGAVAGCDPTFDCSQIIDVQCLASGLSMDRMTLDQDAHRLDLLYFLLRRSNRFTSWGDGMNPGGSPPLRRFFFTYQGASGVDACDTIP